MRFRAKRSAARRNSGIPLTVYCVNPLAVVWAASAFEDEAALGALQAGLSAAAQQDPQVAAAIRPDGTYDTAPLVEALVAGGHSKLLPLLGADAAVAAVQGTHWGLFSSIGKAIGQPEDAIKSKVIDLAHRMQRQIQTHATRDLWPLTTLNSTTILAAFGPETDADGEAVFPPSLSPQGSQRLATGLASFLHEYGVNGKVTFVIPVAGSTKETGEQLVNFIQPKVNVYEGATAVEDDKESFTARLALPQEGGVGTLRLSGNRVLRVEVKEKRVLFNGAPVDVRTDHGKAEFALNGRHYSLDLVGPQREVSPVFLSWLLAGYDALPPKEKVNFPASFLLDREYEVAPEFSSRIYGSNGFIRSVSAVRKGLVHRLAQKGLVRPEFKGLRNVQFVAALQPGAAEQMPTAAERALLTKEVQGEIKRDTKAERKETASLWSLTEDKKERVLFPYERATSVIITAYAPGDDDPLIPYKQVRYTQAEIQAIVDAKAAQGPPQEGLHFVPYGALIQRAFPDLVPPQVDTDEEAQNEANENVFFFMFVYDKAGLGTDLPKPIEISKKFAFIGIVESGGRAWNERPSDFRSFNPTQADAPALVQYLMQLRVVRGEFVQVPQLNLFQTKNIFALPGMEEKFTRAQEKKEPPTRVGFARKEIAEAFGRRGGKAHDLIAGNQQAAFAFSGGSRRTKRVGQQEVGGSLQQREWATKGRVVFSSPMGLIARLIRLVPQSASLRYTESTGVLPTRETVYALLAERGVSRDAPKEELKAALLALRDSLAPEHYEFYGTSGMLVDASNPPFLRDTAETLARLNPRRAPRAPRRSRRQARTNPLKDFEVEQLVGAADKKQQRSDLDSVFARLSTETSPLDWSISRREINQVFPRNYAGKGTWTPKARFPALTQVDVISRVGPLDERSDLVREGKQAAGASLPSDSEAFLALSLASAGMSFEQALAVLDKQRGKQSQTSTSSASTAIALLARKKRAKGVLLPEGLDPYRSVVLLLSPNNAPMARVMTWRGGVHLDMDFVGSPDTMPVLWGRALQSALYWLAERGKRQNQSVWVARLGEPEAHLVWMPGQPLALRTVESNMAQARAKAEGYIKPLGDQRQALESYARATAGAKLPQAQSMPDATSPPVSSPRADTSDFSAPSAETTFPPLFEAFDPFGVGPAQEDDPFADYYRN